LKDEKILKKFANSELFYNFGDIVRVTDVDVFKLNFQPKMNKIRKLFLIINIA